MRKAGAGRIIRIIPDYSPHVKQNTGG